MGSQGRSAWWTPVPLKWAEPMTSMPGSRWTKPRPGLDRTLGQRTAHWGDSGVWSECGQLGHQVLLGSEGGWWAGTPCPPHETGRECLVGPPGEAESSPCRPAGSWSPISFSLYPQPSTGMGRGPPTSWPLRGICSLSWWPRRKPVVGPECPPDRDRLQGPCEKSGAARFHLHARKSFNGVPSLRPTIRASRGGYHPGPRAQGPLNRS